MIRPPLAATILLLAANAAAEGPQAEVGVESLYYRTAETELCYASPMAR